VTNLVYSVVRRTPLSPDQPQNLRSVITADVNVGVQFQSDQCNNTRFARPQGSPSELPIPVSKQTFDYKVETKSTLGSTKSHHELSR